MTEAAIEWWGKAGQRSLESSALVESAEQFKRALAQIATLPATTALRREQIRAASRPRECYDDHQRLRGA